MSEPEQSIDWIEQAREEGFRNGRRLSGIREPLEKHLRDLPGLLVLFPDKAPVIKAYVEGFADGWWSR